MQTVSPVSIVIMPIAGSAAFGPLLRSSLSPVETDRFSMLEGSPLPMRDDTMRPHPVWRFARWPRPARNEAGLRDTRQDSARKAAEETHWQAIVEQLIEAGLAQSRDGTVTLEDVVRVRRAKECRSTPIYEIDELRRYVALYGSNPRLAGAFIEPVDFDTLLPRVKSLADSISTGTATQADRELHARLFRLLGRRVEDQIHRLWPRDSENPPPTRIF